MATTRSRGQKSQGAYPSLSGKVETAELLRRLKACGQLLTKTDQDGDETDGRSAELERVARELASQQILSHSDRTVRLVAACCLSDVLRIYAPDPPYTSSEIQEILELFVKALNVLSNHEAKDFSRAYYLLENISIVKLFLLCTELDDADELISSVFRLFFEIVDEKHSIKIRNYFLDVLSTFIAEQETMPQQVLDSILMQLTEELRHSAAAGALSRDLLQKCSSSLEPYIQQHFNRALLVGKSSESDLSDYNLYELIFELNQAAPSVLLSVLPQLEFKLKSTDKDEREEVARLLARMFASPDSSLAEENRPLWRCWLGRFRDIVPGIRCICVQFSKYFLVYHQALAFDVEEYLVNAGNDPDETVRSAVVVTLQETALQSLTSLTEKLWQILQKRLLDRKVSVRLEAMTALATIYNNVHMRCLNKEGNVRANKKTLQDLAWIPSKIFQLYYQPSTDDSLGVERSLLLHLVPVMASDEQRVSLLFHIYTVLDDVAVRAFNEMLRKREGVRRGLVELLRAYKAADKPRCAAQCLHLAKSLPECGKAHDHLKQIVGMLKNRKLFDGLQNCAAVEKGCAFVRKAMLGVLKELQDTNVFPAVVATFKALMDRAAPLLVDSGFVSLLLEKIASEVDFAMNDDSESDTAPSDDEDEDCAKPVGSRRNSAKPGSGQLPLQSRRGLQLIMALASQYPALFQMQDVYEQLMSFLKHDTPFVVEAALHMLKDVGGEVEKTHPSVATCLGPVLSQLALRGTPRQAKLSLRCVQLLLGNKDSITEQIMQGYMKELEYGKDNLLTTITGLGHVADLAPAVFAPHQKAIIRNFLVKHLLVKDREGRGFRLKDPEWQDESRTSRETLLKMASLKLLVRWLSSLPADEELAVCTPVLRLLHCMLQNEGDLNALGKTVAWEKSRLRLCAACCLLKVASMERFFKQVDSDMFLDIALMTQDSCLEVRSRFENKLHKWLARMVLPIAYLSLLALAAPDPVKDQRNHVRHHLTYSISSRRDMVKTNLSLADKVEVILPEYSVPYLIHLLAHHPDLQESSPETLSQLKEYLWFFLEPPMLRSDTYGFLKKMVETIKQTRDATAPSDPEENTAAQKRLYVVCDMALGLMASKVTSFTSEPFPGRVVVPSRLFAKVSKDAPLNVSKYLPPTFSFSPTGKKRGVDLGVGPAPSSGKSRSKEPSKASSTAKAKDESPTTRPSPSSRPSRSAKDAANVQLSATKDRGSDADDSGNESDGESDSVRATEASAVEGIEEFSSTAEPSSESPDGKPSALAGRGRPLKQTTLTEMSSSSGKSKPSTAAPPSGRGRAAQTRETATGGRARSPLKRPANRKESASKTPTRPSAKTAGVVSVSPNLASSNSVMEQLNSTVDSDREQPNSADMSPAASKRSAVAASGRGAKRSLSAQLNQSTEDDSVSADKASSRSSSGAAKKARKDPPSPTGKKQRPTKKTALEAESEEAATTTSRSPRKGAKAPPPRKGAAAAASDEEEPKESSAVRTLNVKRSTSRRR